MKIQTINSISLSSHSILLIQDINSDLKKSIYDIIFKLIECKDNINIDYYKNKIINNNFLDIIWLNNDIKKDNILDLKYIASLESNEKLGLKFFIINNIDKLSKTTLNSLLKIIEEPPINTYFIFSTKKIENIIPTIISRCTKIFLESNNKKALEILNNLKLNSDEINFYNYVFYDTNDLENFINSDEFTLINSLLLFFKNDFSNLTKTYLNLDQFNKLEYSQIKLIINCLLNQNIDFEQKKLLIELKNNLKYNPNKTLIYNQIITIMNNSR